MNECENLLPTQERNTTTMRLARTVNVHLVAVAARLVVVAAVAHHQLVDIGKVEVGLELLLEAFRAQPPLGRHVVVRVVAGEQQRRRRGGRRGRC
jgi:hypothetical protein